MVCMVLNSCRTQHTEKKKGSSHSVLPPHEDMRYGKGKSTKQFYQEDSSKCGHESVATNFSVSAIVLHDKAIRTI